MKNLLKTAREQKGLKTRELARLMGIDQALISKFENGSRVPTKDQVLKLSGLLDIDYQTFMVLWIREKIQSEFGNDELTLRAITAILKENDREIPQSKEPKIDSILEEMERLKDKLQQLR